MGQKFGRLEIIGVEIKDLKCKKNQPYFISKCECGKNTISQAYNVLNGQTKSCGCYGLEQRRAGRRKIRTAKLWHIPHDVFAASVKKHFRFCDILKEFGLVIKSSNNDIITQRCTQENIDCSHIKRGTVASKGDKRFWIRCSTEEVFRIYTNDKNEVKRHSGAIKIKFMELRENKCASCGLGNFWNNKEITLQMHHINANRLDNRLENLTLLCPNCHSQTESFGGKKIKGKYTRPHPKEKQILELWNRNFRISDIHKALGCGPPNIRKVLRKHNLYYPRHSGDGIQKY